MKLKRYSVKQLLLGGFVAVTMMGCASQPTTVTTPEMVIERFGDNDYPRLLPEALAQAWDHSGDIPQYMAIVDYSQPSEEERMYVMDLAEGVEVGRVLVAHGVNTGYRKAVSFSNEKGSNKSSLGLFYGQETYDGKNGYSLRIEGVSEGLNTNARERFIVVHGSDYVSYEFLDEHKMLGRSDGCFAIPFSDYKWIIDALQKGGALYVGL